MVSEVDLKAALQRWAEEKGISPAEFARALDYSYNHAYQLLRGDLPVTVETIGRMALAFDAQEVQKLLGYSVEPANE